MNKVLLTGNLCQEVEVKETVSGRTFTKNIVAVQREFKNANGDYESDYITFTAWGGAATYLGNYASKGDKVEIVGRWETGKFETTNGTMQYTNDCIVESIKVYSSKPKEKNDPAPVEEDLPF